MMRDIELKRIRGCIAITAIGSVGYPSVTIKIIYGNKFVYSNAIIHYCYFLFKIAKNLLGP